MVDSPFRKYIKENKPKKVKFKWGKDEPEPPEEVIAGKPKWRKSIIEEIREESTKELRKGINAFEKGLLFGDWEEYQKYIGSEKQMGEKEIYQRRKSAV